MKFKTYLVVINTMLMAYAGICMTTCGDNERLVDCPSNCSYNYCPKSEKDNQECPKPSPCPSPACQCSFNCKRDYNGNCIPIQECPPFSCPRENEEYNSCPPYCPTDDCSQASPSGKCPLLGQIGIVVKCKPACRCIKGYWRKNGICVLYADCNK